MWDERVPTNGSLKNSLFASTLRAQALAWDCDQLKAFDRC